MQQAVAAMLSRAGQYLRRERSFAGIAYVQAKASSLVTINVDGQHGQPSGLLHLYLGSALYFLQGFRNLSSSAVEHTHIVTKHLHRDVTAHT